MMRSSLLLVTTFWIAAILIQAEDAPTVDAPVEAVEVEIDVDSSVVSGSSLADGSDMAESDKSTTITDNSSDGDEIIDLDKQGNEAEAVHEGSTKTLSDEEPGASVEGDETAADSLSEEESEQFTGDEVPLLEEESSDASSSPDRFVELLGSTLISLEMIDATHGQLVPHNTTDALRGKKVIGLYFSADWCGPCQKFTPELVSFYEKMNNRRFRKDEFEIVWVSRSHDIDGFSSFFPKMGNWLALPPEEALGKRGVMLAEKYRAKTIPTLVLLDDIGNVITTDARNMIPKDRAGIGFPWRNPISSLYLALVPKSLRSMLRLHVEGFKSKWIQRFKLLLGLQRST